MMHRFSSSASADLAPQPQVSSTAKTARFSRLTLTPTWFKSGQIAVVAVGSSVEASVLVASNLVDLGIRQIWAKAISQSHGKILERIGVNHVIYPEREAGLRVAHLVSGQMLDFIQFDDDFVLVKMFPPRAIRGMSLAQSSVRSRYRITVVGVKSPGKPFTYATADTVVSDHDLIIVSGATSDVESFSAIG
jgi:trk system potassium uptake protein